MWLAKLCSCTGPQSNIRYNEAFGSINKLEGIKYTEMYKVRHNLRQVFCFHEGTLEKIRRDNKTDMPAHSEKQI